jgi:hypothetical protein
LRLSQHPVAQDTVDPVAEFDRDGRVSRRQKPHLSSSLPALPVPDRPAEARYCHPIYSTIWLERDRPAFALLQGGCSGCAPHDPPGNVMTTTINLNADLGEDFGAYKIIPHRVHIAAATAARTALEQAGVEVVTLPKTTFE